MPAFSQLDELRIKTDRQLVELVSDAIAFGIREALQALRSADSLAFAEGHYLRAKRAHVEASRLIPLAGQITILERSQWEAGLDHLREMLARWTIRSMESQRLPRGVTGR
jgi:hypothetical protein